MKALLPLMLLAWSGAAAAEVRAVFIGIDHYDFSRARLPGAGFDDLSGAVGDTVRIKAAIATAYGITVDAPVAGKCRSANRVSETLTDSCATKAAILGSWERALAASAPGDTLILYFAGHGSRFIDDRALDQASRYNSTLMAADARQPGAQTGADILDHEVRAFIDRATGSGVRVVTLFDSCNSGTASRDGNSASRTAPDLRVAGLQPLAAPAQYGSYGAYRVHIGAAGDGQDAKEVGSVGARAGVFTTALAAALVDSPQASFADLAARVVRDVTAATRGRQVPHAEGALRASWGGPEIKVPTFEVVRDGDRLVMAGGALVGITQGSRFALFAATSDALRAGSNALRAGGDAPLIVARVSALAAGTATLTPEAAPPANLPGRLVACELSHDFGSAKLRLAVTDAAALAVTRQLGFVTEDPRGPFALLADAGGMVLRGRGGVVLARLPTADDPAFAVQLAAALEKVARVEAWLAVVTPRAGDTLGLCVQNTNPATFDPAWCPEPPAGGRTLKVEMPAMVSVVNTASSPRHVYVLAIDDKYEVALVLPAFGAIDPAIEAGQALRPPEGQDIVPIGPGELRFVALASDAPLPAGVLEQSATDVIDLQACLSAVARAFCLGADARRAGGVPQVTAWSTAIATTRVVP